MNTIRPEATSPATILRTKKPIPRTKRRPTGTVVSFKLPTENDDREPSEASGIAIVKAGDTATTNADGAGVGSCVNGGDDRPSALLTHPEVMSAIVMEIDDVPVRAFVAKQQSAHMPAAPVYIDETHRQFANPISYLGGPQLRPRNRNSIESILSLD